MALSRRTFFKSALATAALPTAIPLSSCSNNGDTTDSTSDLSKGTFIHGVASGDPLSDRVILWTRFTPPTNYTNDVWVNWQISTDSYFQQIVNQGATYAYANKDFTVKVDATGLAPYTTYYYRFNVGTLVSPTGRTKTLPVGDVSQIKLAFASCSSYSAGYFNAYARLAEYLTLDVVLHLGDYIYEYGTLDDAFIEVDLPDRVHEPQWEIVSLSDYRTRHAQYKRDVDLQNAHAAHPWICVWDDHDFADNTYHNGADNHQPATEGLWSARSAAAKQAYIEWLPIRENTMTAESKIYREFRFGNLINLDMLDTRYIGRDAQVAFDGSQDTTTRTLMGLEQEAWLNSRLSASKQDNVTWNLLGQQVMMMQVMHSGKYGNNDQWDGYNAARLRLLNYIKETDIKNVVVLTGDIHLSLVGELCLDPYDPAQYNPATGDGAIAVEFVGTSITSPAQDLTGSSEPINETNGLILMNENPHFKYLYGTYHGFSTLTITKDNIIADYIYVGAVDKRTKDAAIARSFEVKSGKPHILAYTHTK